MIHPSAALSTALLVILAACQAPPPARVTGDAAVRADCRAQVEREYNAQNRVDLTRRDERDYAFAGTYNAGISSRGLSSEYGRDKMIDGCLRANADRTANPTTGVGPAFSPAARGTGGSSLSP